MDIQYLRPATALSGRRLQHRPGRDRPPATGGHRRRGRGARPGASSWSPSTRRSGCGCWSCRPWPAGSSAWSRRAGASASGFAMAGLRNFDALGREERIEDDAARAADRRAALVMTAQGTLVAAAITALFVALPGLSAARSGGLVGRPALPAVAGRGATAWTGAVGAARAAAAIGSPAARVSTDRVPSTGWLGGGPGGSGRSERSRSAWRWAWAMRSGVEACRVVEHVDRSLPGPACDGRRSDVRWMANTRPRERGPRGSSAVSP